MAKTKAQIKADIARLTKRIRDKNYRFRKLTDAQKRVRIAKDVIQNIKVGKLIAANAGYLNLPHDMDDIFEAKESLDDYEYQIDDEWRSTEERRRAARELKKCEETLETPLHVVFDEAPSCTVCAIGGVFVSAVLRTDGLKVGDIDNGGDSDKMREYLNEYFSYEQLGLIEAAFEQASHFAEIQGASLKSAVKASNFGRQHDQPDDRMLAIMENVIQNEGTFRP